MNILIICTHFPPDSAVAAVKPYEIAKYLVSEGHNVTVIRYGDFWRSPDGSYGDYKSGMNVITALGKKSDVEKYEHGKYTATNYTSKFSSLPKLLVDIIKTSLSPVIAFRRYMYFKKRLIVMNSAIDKLNDDNMQFDIIYATYKELQNIFAGQYAAKVFNAKLIQEFRDPIVDYRTGFLKNLIWNIYAKWVQKQAIENADITTCVSKGMVDEFIKVSPSSRIELIYNGYDSECDSHIERNSDLDFLSIGYTGTMYDDCAEALDSLVRIIAELIKERKIERNKIKYKYAGSNSDITKSIFVKYGILDVFEDYGYVSREEAQSLQKNIDIFLVLSWNTKVSKGILTGKFYEGIRACKPILSVVTGNVPKSELWELNKKYHYGYCYESCRGKNADDTLKKFLCTMYEQKFSNEGIRYKANPALIEDFHYKNITKKMEHLCCELMKEV